ncbi:MAG: hypothetical protein AAF747_11850 [Planctomycetota bacterium]
MSERTADGPTGFVPSHGVPYGAPAGFVSHTYASTIDIPASHAAVWAWLNDPATFVEGQIWPYRVEFLDTRDDRSGHVATGFEKGVLNTHHGPLLNCAGILTDVQHGSTRELRYFYGSFIMSHRLVRPLVLRFRTPEPTGAADANVTPLTVEVECLVRHNFVGIWNTAQGVFWRRFFKWTTSAAKRHEPKAAPAEA